jgi:hypothetical protein
VAASRGGKTCFGGSGVSILVRRFKGKELLGREGKRLLNSVDWLAASVRKAPRAKAVQIVGITIAISRVKYVLFRGEEKTYVSGMAIVQRGPMHAFIFRDAHLAGQGAQTESPAAVPRDPRPMSIRRRFSRKFIKHGHWLVMVLF